MRRSGHHRVADAVAVTGTDALAIDDVADGGTVRLANY